MVQKLNQILLLGFGLLALALFPSPALAYSHWSGYCQQGGQKVLTNSIQSTTSVQQSYPNATINVFDPGTQSRVTLYSDQNSTPLSNPFTCSKTGYFSFYAEEVVVDIQFSGGGIPAPFTWGAQPELDYTLIDLAYPTLQAGCMAAAAVPGGGKLVIKKLWLLEPTETLACATEWDGGQIQPASSAVVTLTVTPDNVTGQLFDTSIGGAGSLILGGGFSRPEWFGASGNSSAHDDTPGVNAAIAAVNTVTGSTVQFNSSSTYWLNSDTFGATSVQVCGSNMTVDGQGARLATMLNEPGLLMGPCSTQSAANQIPTKYSFESFGTGGVACVAVQSGMGSTMAPGTAVYYQSGTVLSGTPINSEVNVVSTQTGDTICLKYPIEHTFTYSAPPDGIGPIPAAWMQQNFTLKNFKTQPQLGKSPFSIVNVINGQVQNVDVDLVPGRDVFLTGDSRNVTIENSTLAVQPVGGDPCFQFATGMSDTYILNSHINCTGPGACVGIDFSEGASNSVFRGNTLHGNCAVGASTFQGAYITSNDIDIDTGNGGVLVFTGAGTDASTHLEITGNKITSGDNTNASAIFLAVPGARFLGNQLEFVSPNTHGVITLTNNCTGCVANGNTGTFNGWALTDFSLTNHNFTESGNNFTCSGSGCAGAPGIFVNNDGVQTVSETITGNTITGFAIGIWIGSMANEFNPVLAPNSLAANTAQYDPASIMNTLGSLGLTSGELTDLHYIERCGPNTSGITTTAELVIDCAFASLQVQFSAPNGFFSSIVFGSPANPSNGFIKYDDSIPNFQLGFASSSGINFAASKISLIGVSGSGSGGAAVCIATDDHLYKGPC